MMNNKLHTPYGVRDYLPQDLVVKDEVEKRILAVFGTYGFLCLKSPMFEYIEVFEGKGSLSEKQMYKFIDRDGGILALRPDMTPAIARIAATNFTKESVPLRFCYVGNVFRYNESYQGKAREFTQAGIELIGVNSHEANAEVIAVAINSLLSTGLKDFRIDIGQVAFLKAVMEESGLSGEQQRLIHNHIIEKNFVALKSMVEGVDMPQGVKELLVDLPMFIGNTDVLEKARALTDSPKAQEALTRLEIIYDSLKCYGLEQYIRFDLSAIGHFDYYTGIIFSGYTFGTGFSILDGGRYDNLMGKFGADLPSVGFSVKINELLSALKNQNAPISSKTAQTLVVYKQAGQKTALQTADALRRQGLVVENSLLGEDIDVNTAYAKRKGINGILHFIDEQNIEIIDIANNEKNAVTVAELLKGDAQ